MRKIYLLLGLFIFIVGCEKDEVQLLEGPRDTPGEQSVEPPSNLKYVKAKEIPKVLHVLESHLGKTDKSLSSIVYKKADIDLNAIVDLSTILEVVSSGKRTNYTFPLELEGQPENEFYNVIVHKTASGKIRKPYVKRYRVDPDALESYKAHNRDFRYFKGTFSNHWLEDFFNAFDNEGGKFKFKAVSSCDDVGTIGGGGTYNPDLIDVNNNVTWNGLGQTGYGRALGTWNNYGGTGGYDLEVGVRNNSTGYREVATVSSITSGSVVVSTGYSSITVSVYGNVTWMDISTETTGSSGGSTGGGCSGITITRGTDGGYTVDAGDCLPAQKNSQPNTKAAGDCPGDDGEVGVITSTILVFFRKNLNLSVESLEYQYLSGERSPEEEAQILKLEVYLRNNNTTETKQFGLEALRAIMAVGEVDFEDKIILDSSFKNHSRLKCVYDKFKTGTNTIAGYLNNFLPDNAVGHLNFSVDSNFASNFPDQTTAGASTNPPVNGANGSNVPGYNINIVFNTDATLTSSAQNFPSIILAQELIHEMVHAEMYRKLLECAQLPHVNYNNYTGEQWGNFLYSLRHNYEGLHDYYMRYKFYKENGQLIPIEGPTEEQHQQMASHYRNMMIDALKDFDNNQHSPEFYNAIAWIGLKGTVAWNSPSVNQSQINSIITNAITNETHNCTN